MELVFKGIRLNIAVQQDSLFKADSKVRDKIVADGLKDGSFEFTKRAYTLMPRF